MSSSVSRTIHPDSLRRDGPIVAGYVLPYGSLSVKALLLAAGQQMPTRIIFLVDTGATFSAIDVRILTDLGHLCIDFRKIVGVSANEAQMPVFRVDIGIMLAKCDGTDDPFVQTLDVVGIPLADGSPWQGVIGRDFLQHLDLYYEGSLGRVTLLRKL
jgi:predicted aspartyl protease